MTKRKRRLFAVLGLVAMMGLLEVLALLPSWVNQLNCARVQPGMTLAEVQSILGKPESYSDWVTTGFSDRYVTTKPKFLEFATWRGDGYFETWFSLDGHVTHTDYHQMTPRRRGIFEFLRHVWRQVVPW